MADIMNSCYYKEKLPRYHEEIVDGTRQVVNLYMARQVVKTLMEKYDTNIVIAHNAGFDSRCLREVFRCYRMDYPEFVFHDTLAASKKHFQGTIENHQLQTVAAACGYDLTNHHHALADAEACAWIAREIL